jgi:hypothetical protein
MAAPINVRLNGVAAVRRLANLAPADIAIYFRDPVDLPKKNSAKSWGIQALVENALVRLLTFIFCFVVAANSQSTSLAPNFDGSEVYFSSDLSQLNF